MKSLTVVLGALTVFALGACKVETSGSTSTGAGGGSTTTTGGVGGAGGSGATSTSTGMGTGGAPACDMNLTCADAITDPAADPNKLCAGAAADAYDAYYACICEAAGPCGTLCGMAYCSGTAPTAECTTCLQDTTDKGCGKQAETCANN